MADKVGIGTKQALVNAVKDDGRISKDEIDSVLIAIGGEMAQCKTKGEVESLLEMAKRAANGATYDEKSKDILLHGPGGGVMGVLGIVVQLGQRLARAVSGDRPLKADFLAGLDEVAKDRLERLDSQRDSAGAVRRMEDAFEDKWRGDMGGMLGRAPAISKEDYEAQVRSSQKKK